MLRTLHMTSLPFSGQLRVNEEAYEAQRQKLGDAFYPSAGDILTTGILFNCPLTFILGLFTVNSVS